MTTDLVFAGTALGVTAMLCLTMLRAWRGWLDLRRLELARHSVRDESEQEVGVRIEARRRQGAAQEARSHRQRRRALDKG